jgi:hypothetical protein
MNDSILKQLTAYVDGELSPAETDAVNILLRESAEARNALRALQRDQERLRALRQEQATIDFSVTVVDRILRGDRYRRAGWHRRSLWPTAAAASLLLGLGLATFLLIQHWSKTDHRPIAELDLPPTKPAGLATNSPPAGGKAPVAAVNELRSKLPTRDQWNEVAEQVREAFSPVGERLARIYRSGQDTLVSALDREVLDEGGAGEPGLGSPTILTSQMHASQIFKTVAVSKAPFFFDVKDLDSSKLIARLREDGVQHMDLSCHESWRALERLQAACRASGVKLLLDAEVTQRLNQKAPAPYMVYLENVSPEIIAKVVENLRSIDKRAEQAKKGDTQFGSVLVLPLDEAGRKRLANSLGVPPSSLVPGKVKKPDPRAKVDPTQPIAKETEKALDKLATGQGRGAGKDPTAVVLVAVPHRNRVSISKEVKAHLDSRTGAQADHINVVFFLRAGRG